jgi:hypothetical protein
MITLLASTLFALLAQSGSATVPAETIEIARWSTYEMTLTATGRYDSPALSVDLTGVFNGPDGQAVVIKGFWDGGQTFRIRFTPTREGVWTFMTVSDDAGLDGRLGSITCVKAKDGTHGFVRQSSEATGSWTYDDGVAVGKEVPAVATRPDGVNLATLRAMDTFVAAAAAAGRVAEIPLFDTGDPSPMSEPQAYHHLEFMTARYGAFPNVVWCLHPASRNAHREPFWRTARGLTQTLDPYFGQAPNLRVLFATCTPPEATPDTHATAERRSS